MERKTCIPDLLAVLIGEVDHAEIGGVNDLPAGQVGLVVLVGYVDDLLDLPLLLVSVNLTNTICVWGLGI